MENIIHRLDFYLEEPLSEKSIADLYDFTQVNKKYVGIPDDLDVLWIKTQYQNIQDNDGFEHTARMVRAAIKNPTQIIIFWAGDALIIPTEWWVIDKLNKFSESIPNPVILFTASIPTKPTDYGELKFTISPIMYFEYESKEAWGELPSVSDKIRTKKFMFMGTKDYPYRKFLLSLIIQNNMLGDGYVSYKSINTGFLSGRFTPEQKGHIIQQANSIDSYLPLPELDNSVEYTKMPRHFMYDSYVNMVTDTFYEPFVGTFISEKVFNAIAHQQMFIMMSPPHTLKHLQSIGYKTFGEYIDESYDSIEDNYERLLALTNSFVKFTSQPIEQIREIYNECKPIVEHNLSRLLQNNFSEFMVSELNRAKREKTQIK